jgi:RNA polymerase sigma factor (sigma-70 family)
MEWTSPVRSQAARSSAAAFTAVYERHHRALYRYCRSLLGDDEEARDALQSTMAKAFAALRFEERDFDVRPWLFRIAHNEAVSRLRQRRVAVDLDVVDTLTTDSLAQTVEVRERIAQLRADLEDLPERQRAALVMRELSGLGHAEIAAVLGGSPQTVKQTIFEARSALHECVEGRGMACAEVQRMLSDGDGRVLRGRRMRAHVRACRACREFKAALAERPADLAALAPGAAVGAMWLGRLLAAAGGSSAGGVAGTLALKTVAVVVAAATLAGTATAVHEATSRSAPAAALDRAAARVSDVRDAGRRAARAAVLTSRRLATSGEPLLSTSAKVAPSAKPSAVERPATPASGEDAEPATKASHPSAGQPASKSHDPRKAAAPAKHSHVEHAAGVGHAKQAPPGHTKPAHAGRTKPASPGHTKPAHAGGAKLVSPGQAKPIHAGGAKPVSPGQAKPIHAGGAKPAAPGQAKPAPPRHAKPAHAGDAQPVSAGQAKPAHADDAKPAHTGDANPAHAGDTGRAASGGPSPGTGGAAVPGSAAAGAPPEPGASGRAHASK